MGIQLDWQVEADQSQMSAQEDPERKKQRRRERRNIILASLAPATCLCAGIIAAAWRLRVVEERDKEDLTAAVEAEVAAIRVGDPQAFGEMQRSGDENFLDRQDALFEEYQTFKVAGRLNSEFEILDIQIEGERSEKGRVLIQEMIDGVPYQQVWFYWRYEPKDDDDSQAGWRHVPPDVEFWGEEKTIENDHAHVTYYEVDAAIAEPLAVKLEAWWVMGCTLLVCPSEPDDLEFVIDPKAGVDRAWEPSDGWRLRVVSPYLNNRVPASAPVPPAFEQDIATMIAKRLLTHATSGGLQFPENEPIDYDSTWVKYQLLDWLVAQFLGQPAPFMDSLVQTFGESVPDTIARSISSSQQLNQVAPALAAANLKDIEIGRLGLIQWQEFFLWRMQLERDRLQQADAGNFFALYEGGEANPAAQTRVNDPNYAISPLESIQSIAFSFRNDGTMAAVLSVVDANGTATQIQFMWNGDTFLRVN